jgi:hypothetical protein
MDSFSIVFTSLTMNIEKVRTVKTFFIQVIYKLYTSYIQLLYKLYTSYKHYIFFSKNINEQGTNLKRVERY